MGIFTEDLNSDSILNWVFNYKSIKYDWVDPIDEIIEKIKYYGEKS